MLKKEHRLHSSRDFNTIFKHGVKSRKKYGMLIALSPKDPDSTYHPKFGFVVSRKVGNAVIRHRMSRWLRHIIIENIPYLETIFKGYKFSFIAFEMPETYEVLKEELLSTFKSFEQKRQNESNSN